MSIIKEIDDTYRQKVDFIIQNSNYTTDYILSVDFSEFYEIILIVERNLKAKTKQL